MAQGSTNGEIASHLHLSPHTVKDHASAVYRKLGFDPLKMTFVGSALESLYALFVRSDAPWKTVGELVDYAKANPNKLVTANSGGWGLPDIGMAQLANAVGGMQYRTVPTSGGGEQVLKLIAGDVQSELNSATPTAPHYRSGAIRALMVVSPAWPELEAKGVPLSSARPACLSRSARSSRTR